MAERPVAETIRALQELQDVAGRETEDVESSVASEIEAVVDALRSVSSMNVSREIEEVSRLGETMIDRVQQAGREVIGAIDGEIGGLHDLIRDDTSGSLTSGGVVSSSLATQFPQFENEEPENLDLELMYAESVGVRRMTVDDPDFDEVINSGKVKWAVLPDGQLYVMQKDVYGDGEHSHTVLSQGGAVIAAGDAIITGSADAGYVGLKISNFSGHYHPPPHTLDIGLEAFADAGIHFAEEGQERTDG